MTMVAQHRFDGSFANTRLSRRAVVGGAAAVALPALLTSRRAAIAATNLDFVVWSYAVDLVQDNIKLFQQANSDIAVALSDFAWNAYHETMVNRFRS
ncbi:MAG TPA: hypothetical protein VFI22_08470, partial [Thermomicrobiales bacterium]|nr:hypothetical protein [Thermomicrobiales bacterium]